MIAFVHIEKAAGTTIYYILRAAFGLKHMDVKTWNKNRDTFNADDLKKYLSINPYIISIAGHSVKPHSNLEKIRPEIKYFTFVKNPIDRYISHYRYRVEKMGFKWSFTDYLKMDQFKNFQVKKIAGSESLDKAKEHLVKFLFVGIVEQFDLSLILLQKKMLPFLSALGIYSDFNVQYISRNVASKRQLANCKADYKKYSDRIIENNEIDIMLYRWVSDILLEREKLRFSGDLEAEMKSFIKKKQSPDIRLKNLMLNKFLRNMLFRPFNEAARYGKIFR
jgi:hypothetical protein